ncbi:TLC ATP/ADP transporter [Planctomycetes bacterium Poly30]|uniref:ADP,ATP carrier protein n=1 Tax=Saltatorellus ferox TaxID=2528018 RepID=A0A518ET13_9BACT|nr:TLC ATP/ADP transporter [Planctomycetes bacterium Poly30]
MNAPIQPEESGAPRRSRNGGTLLSFFNLRPGEVGPVLLAGAMFFCILCGYFFIRPVRDAFGVERGMSNLYSLFVATMVVSLALNPVFSWLVGRFDRRVFLPVAYGSIVLMLLGLAAWRASAGDQAASVWSGRIFFVWLSVINLFMTGLFWSLMADCFGPEESRRVFPTIAVGGTLGALFGSAGAWAVSGYPFELFGKEFFNLEIKLTAPQMMLMAAGFVGVAGAASVIMSRIRPYRDPGNSGRVRRSALHEAMDGMRLAIRSRYLMFIASYIALLAVLATFLYFTQNELVLAAEKSESGRVGAFASIDFWTQLATLLVQLFVTARLMRWLGVGWTLALLPALVLAGYGLLAMGEINAWSAATMLGAITIIQAVFRAGKYAVLRPARETLFTVLSRDETYKAKSLIDTFVYRAGDTAGAGVSAGLSALALGTMTALSLTVAPIAIVMAGLALSLGAERARRSGDER